MTSERDVERVLERWLVDGIDEMPDRVFVSIVDRVERQPQRRAWRLRSWRFPTMSTPLKLALTGAALLAVLLGGTVFLSGGGIGPGPTPSPTPSPTNSPTTSPQGLAKDANADRGRAGRVHVLEDHGTGGLVRGPGRVVHHPQPGNKRTHRDLGHGHGRRQRPQRPVRCGRQGVGRRVRRRTSSRRWRRVTTWSSRTRVDTTLGGYSGTRVDVEAPADLGICPDDCVFIFAEPDGSGLPAQGPSNLLRTWILDVDGQPIIVVHRELPRDAGRRPGRRPSRSWTRS